MGAFDRFMRITAKKEYRRKSQLLHTKSRGKHILRGREEIPRSLQVKVLEFGSGVHMMMKFETENLLLQTNPCTVYQLSVALETSDDLKRSIQIDRSMDELTNHGRTEDPWKNLVIILQRTQMQTNSQSSQIKSWTEAEEWLESLGVTLRSETSAEAEQKSLETFKLHMAKTTEALVRKFRMKNFKIRMLSHRLKEIACHRSVGDDLKNLEQDEEDAYQQVIRASDDSRVPEAVKNVEARMLALEREEEANSIASSLLKPLTDEEREIVNEAIYGTGSPTQIIAQVDSDVIVRESMQRLRPGQWLNDEVIHYFMVMLSKRDEALCKQDPSRGRCHFFKSFFITKLLNEGHANPKVEGTYDYKNVKRWSKNVPGKDVFKLNKIVFPINQGNAHWISVVAFIREKRIQVFDSLGGSGEMYLDAIFKYLQDEHQDKKKCPLPDPDAWDLIPTLADTPRQLNGKLCLHLSNMYVLQSPLTCKSFAIFAAGFDCGVFTCMFADFVSNDYPLVFSQKHVTQGRDRIALSIMKGKALM